VSFCRKLLAVKFGEAIPISELSRANRCASGSIWPSRRRLIFALLLPFLLLLTQQAAFVHELGHFAQQVQRSNGPDRQSQGGDYCEKCFVFAHLSGVSAAAPPSVLPVLAADQCLVAPHAVEKLAQPSACRIRGPPVYL
jgi:hypothetical protein